MQRLDVSRGKRLNFAADNKPISGVIVDSDRTDPLYASVKVETTVPIINGAQLTIPDLPAAGGCGLASPVSRPGRTVVILSVGYSYVDVSTIGK